MVSSNLATQDLGRAPDGSFEMPAISPAGGVYYDWNFGRTLGLNTGTFIRFESQDVSSFCIFCLDDRQVRFIYQTVEFPVNLTANLNSKETADVKTYFSAGYTYSYLVSLVRKDLQTGETFNAMGQFGIPRNRHYLNIAFEGRYHIKDKFSVGFSPFARILVSEPLEVASSYVGFALKFGRIL